METEKFSIKELSEVLTHEEFEKKFTEMHRMIKEIKKIAEANQQQIGETIAEVKDLQLSRAYILGGIAAIVALLGIIGFTLKDIFKLK